MTETKAFAFFDSENKKREKGFSKEYWEKHPRSGLWTIGVEKPREINFNDIVAQRQHESGPAGQVFSKKARARLFSGWGSASGSASLAAQMTSFGASSSHKALPPPSRAAIEDSSDDERLDDSDAQEENGEEEELVEASSEDEQEPDLASLARPKRGAIGIIIVHITI
jgi:hypothetical protein